MKPIKLIVVLAAATLTMGLIVGCGGGGSSSNTAATAQLSPQNVNKFVQSVSDEVGCSYEPTQTAPQLRGVDTFLPVKQLTKDVSDILDQNGLDTNNLKNLREPQVTQGSCGGTLTTTSSDGKSATYAFNNYCNESTDGVKSYINGSMALSTSSSGESMTFNFSANSLNVKSTNPNTHESVNVTTSITGGRFYSSNGNLSVSADNTTGTKTLTISKISIKDNTSGESYTFQNVSVNMNGPSTTFSSTYTDPDLGVVTISSSGDVNGKNGTVTITGAGGQTAEIKSGSNGLFNVTSESKVVGVMDCSVTQL